mmetsp:Transcript_15833/g.41678  ORF Transcript_15833/g.41678 Transcript_15833/m.41678 type:complete len:242 (-) Transcript_15833:403-1128(-)
MSIRGNCWAPSAHSRGDRQDVAHHAPLDLSAPRAPPTVVHSARPPHPFRPAAAVSSRAVSPRRRAHAWKLRLIAECGGACAAVPIDLPRDLRRHVPRVLRLHVLAKVLPRHVRHPTLRRIGVAAAVGGSKREEELLRKGELSVRLLEADEELALLHRAVGRRARPPQRSQEVDARREVLLLEDDQELLERLGRVGHPVDGAVLVARLAAERAANRSGADRRRCRALGLRDVLDKVHPRDLL